MIYSLLTLFYYIKIMQVFLVFDNLFSYNQNIQVQIIDAPGKVIYYLGC